MKPLPQGWVEIALGSFATKTANINPALHGTTEFELYSVPAFANGEPDVVQGTDVGSTKQVVHAGDVLLCKIIPHLNRVWSITKQSKMLQIASPEWLVYRDHGCLPKYLQAVLSENSFREQFLQTKSGLGGSLTRARTDLVNNIKIPIAPYPEQDRIVTKVDQLKLRIARTRKELDRVPILIARYKQRLLELAFTGALTANWRVGKGLQEPVLTKVNDLAEELRYGTAQKCIVKPHGIAVLRIPNVVSGRIKLDDLKYTELEDSEIDKLSLIEGDILVVRSNGRIGMV